MKARCTELELEQADTSNKYLKLYDENDRLQELLSTCQAQMLQLQAVIDSMPKNGKVAELKVSN